MSAYELLVERFGEVNAIKGAMSMLHWDTETMMPDGAIDIRTEQLVALGQIVHERMTDPHMADWIERAESDSASLSDWQQANLQAMKYRFQHANALPGDLVKAFSKATSQCEHIWRQTRKDNDYQTFLPYFEEVLKLVRESSHIKAEYMNMSAYDALLDYYDPGMDSAKIDGYFTKLETFLPDFVQEVLDHQQTITPITDRIPIEKQSALGLRFMKALGFDFNHGRIDTSAHPFCGGVPGDIRLTTRYNDETFTESLFGVLHETGHALYEMGLPEAWLNQPVGEARGMSMHESQSLLVEMQLCRGPDFIAYALPIIREEFGVSGNAWDDDNFYRSLIQVERSLIRVNADEVTYPLHVILRYRLEKAMLSGDLQAADLPSAWDEMMEKLLHIKPDCVGNGCMQDTHWPGGAIGYFPTYTVGAMIAAQLMDAIRQSIPDLSAQIRKGEFGELFGWLKTNIHSLGSKLSTDDLIAQATGQPLNVDIYQAHLKQRYLG